MCCDRMICSAHGEDVGSSNVRGIRSPITTIKRRNSGEYNELAQ